MKNAKKVKLINANELRSTVLKWRNQEATNDNTITGPAIIDAFDDVLDAIDLAPAIAPETLRPVARWEGQYDGYFDGEPVCDVWKCSGCGHIIDDGTDCEDDLPHYCPQCGAKMENDND